MQVTEAVNDGLKRELKVVFPKNDMSSRLDERLEEMKGQVRLNGFRPGKVPKNHLKKVYGKQVMAEIVNGIISENTGEIIKGREERAAQQPEINMTEDEGEVEAILAGEADFEYVISYEVIPPIKLPELEKIKVERPIAEVTDAEIDEQIERIAENTRPYEAKEGEAADKDQVTLNYVGKIDGEPFEGGADNDSKLVLGSGRFIPGFEDQLLGVKAGDEKTIKVTFPEDYSASHLAGKEAEFDVTISQVEAPGELEINDELAEKMGLESLEKMRDMIKEQIEGQFGSFTRAKVKRQVLDIIDEMTEMELPGKMVEQEFSNIWGQVSQELENAGKTFEDEDTSEEEARAEYRKLAERRVCLGLVLAEIGEKAEIQVSEEELQRALIAHMQQYPGQEQMIMQYFREHPDALAGLRAPIFEDKVIDFILTKADVTDKTVSKEELMKQDDEDELLGSGGDVDADAETEADAEPGEAPTDEVSAKEKDAASASEKDAAPEPADEKDAEKAKDE